MTPARSEEQSPASLDALVAAPDHHKLLFETDQVRVLETRIAAGDRTPVHTHCWPAVLCFLSRSAFVRRDGEGKVMVDSRTLPTPANPPDAIWSPPFPPHSLENVGDTDIRVIAVELKFATK